MENPNDSLLQDWVVNCSVASSNWDAFKLAQVTMKTFDISCATHISNQLESCTHTTSVSARIHFDPTQLFVVVWMLNCLVFLTWETMQIALVFHGLLGFGLSGYRFCNFWSIDNDADLASTSSTLSLALDPTSSSSLFLLPPFTALIEHLVTS